ncbi:hypothetical protein HAX54_052701 [Datura stramonium]|uniref:Uncharacterized protein n=1 Tax=Datura stramonium TaxID=4076 RepID=A0ABS8T093_DATST|nr:hypothetical protein [Datura stramonium]
MEVHYITFKETRSIIVEAQFEVESFKEDFLGIYNQIGTRDLGPFTVLVDPYFPELVWEFYASYKGETKHLQEQGPSGYYDMCPSILLRGSHVAGVGLYLDHSIQKYISFPNCGRNPYEMHHENDTHQCGVNHCRTIKEEGQIESYFPALSQPYQCALLSSRMPTVLAIRQNCEGRWSNYFGYQN